jgi:hypothetical protein
MANKTGAKAKAKATKPAKSRTNAKAANANRTAEPPKKAAKATKAAKSATKPANVTPANRPAAAAVPTSKSCYLLELSVEPGGARRWDVFAYNSPEHIRRCLEQEFLGTDADATELAAYLAVWYGETIKISIVDDGRVVRTLDLHPFIRVRIGDGPLVPLTESRTYKETWPGEGGEPLGKAVHFELDWPSIRAELPALTGAQLMPGEEDVIAGEELQYGRNDLENAEEPPDDWIDPDPGEE